MFRNMLLVAIALPVVVTSMTLADWAREDPNATAERNVVWRCECRDQAVLGVAQASPGVEPDADLSRACEYVAQRWAGRLGSEYRVITRAPFVLAGNLSVQRLGRVYADTVQPSASALRRQYFRQQPDQPITLLLLKDEATYRDCAAHLFGQHNVSIYGYYKPSSRTIVINLDAGEGTLVHELFHALADFDFPEIPIWLNEGMASLYEQCALANDAWGPTVEPLINWRLAILHEAMAEGQLKPIRHLARSRNFRGPDEAIQYAQARYLCMFLDRHGLLEEYYHAFRNNASEDPTGLRTLCAVFEGQSLSQIDQQFRRWAFGLRVAGDDPPTLSMASPNRARS